MGLPHYRGASTHVLEVARNLAKKGHTVHVICRRVTSSQPRKEMVAGFWVHRIYRGILVPLPGSSYLPGHLETGRSKAWYENLYATYLSTIHPLMVGLIASRIVQREELDVILERESSLGAGGLASLITGRPLVLEVIGPRISRLSLTLAKKVIAYTERSLPQGSTVKQKLEKVSAAADIDMFKPNPLAREAIRNKLGLQSALVVGYAGSFAPWHGIEDLVMAAKTLREAVPSAHFLMVGPYYAKVRELASQLGMLTAFTFTGPVPYEKVPDYLNAADVLVAPFDPSKSPMMHSGFLFSPLKLFEYMACGKPVVTTSVPVVSEIAKNGINAATVPPGHPLELARVIISLLRDSQLAQRIGRSGRKTVVESYSWEAFVDRLSELLDRVVNGEEQ